MVVQAQLNAYNAHDIDRFVAQYSDDIVIQRLATGDLIAQGEDDLREVYGQLFANKNLKAQVTQRIALGDFIIDYEVVDFGDTQVQAILVFQVIESEIKRVWIINEGG